MIDTSHVDLIALAGVPLQKKGRQWVGPCPICRDGRDRFFIDPVKGAWGCRYCTEGSYRGALHFVAMRDGHDLATRDGLHAAAAALHVTVPTSAPISRPARPAGAISAMRTDYAANCEAWQADADAFISRAARMLHSAEGAAVLDYLLGRGLEMAHIDAYSLGFNPTAQGATWGGVDVFTPRGVVIPWENGSHIGRVRFRTRDGYKQAAGAENALYTVGRVGPGSIVVLVEGEFDALSLAGAMRRWELRTGYRSAVRPVATGGTTQARIVRHVVRLSLARRVLVAFDQDANGAGDSGAAWWLANLPNAVRWRPLGHDVNDMVKADGAGVIDWLRRGLQL